MLNIFSPEMDSSTGRTRWRMLECANKYRRLPWQWRHNRIDRKDTQYIPTRYTGTIEYHPSFIPAITGYILLDLQCMNTVSSFVSEIKTLKDVYW